MVDSNSSDDESENDDTSDSEQENMDLDERFDLDIVPNRVSCFAHTLQLCVKDGISASQQVTKVIAKVAKIVNHVKKSTKTTEKLDSFFHKALISKNETRWNSQLKMVRRVIELDVNEVVEKRELHLSSHEKNIIREFVEIFEPFEDATDILQGVKYASICLAIPSYLGLMKTSPMPRRK